MLIVGIGLLYLVLVFLLCRVMMRATPKRFVKTIFLGSLLCFIVVNMNLFLNTGNNEVLFPEQESGPAPLPVDKGSKGHGGSVWNLTLPPGAGAGAGAGAEAAANNLTDKSGVQNHEERVQDPNPKLVVPEKYANRSLYDKDKAVGYLPVGNNISMIKEYIRYVNAQQHILNLDKFDLLGSDNAVVIVVQVHNRVEYLKYLIDSLAKANDIHQTLLIFSHDFFDDEVNQLVHTVDFCPVMQIFYPVMMQLHPNEFPGESPGDCPRDIKKDQAVKLGCTNAEHPDKYGHYREAKYTQTKHHWFWKLNHVFDRLQVTRNFNGPLLLIEEDHFMVEDFVQVLRNMYRLKEQSCHDCTIFTLGTYDKSPQYHATSSKGLFERLFGLNNQDPPPLVDKVDVMNWISSKHNMGMSLNRQVWEQIKKCAVQFCDFDDYNWDWSLQHISMQCLPAKLRVMVMKSPRIYHIGECGVHHKGKNCDPGMKVRQIESLLKTHKDKLFPSALTIAGNPRTPNRMPKPNGGWGDLRDRQLCLNFTKVGNNR